MFLILSGTTRKRGELRFYSVVEHVPVKEQHTDYYEIEYPDNCIVDFDMRLIDLFREMDKEVIIHQGKR